MNEERHTNEINWGELDDQAILDRFSAINCWRRGDERAPHKPLLLVYALARLQRGDSLLIPFATLESDLARLLREFGPPRQSFHPEFPFWHLQSDGLWQIPERARLQADIDAAPHRHNPRITVIREANAHGGLPATLAGRLRENAQLVNQIVQQLLDSTWEPSLHSDILDAVGMPWLPVSRHRDPAFRTTILRIYEHRCAICGWDGMLDNNDLALEAAHIKWHAAGGPDVENNGIALCSIHHKAFDRGAIGLGPQREILISQHLRGSRGIEEWLLRFMGKQLQLPQTGESDAPHLAHVEWHKREVFRGPERVSR